MYLKPLKEAEKKGFYLIKRASFLHLGKAGGGYVKERLKKLRFNIHLQHDRNDNASNKAWNNSEIYLMALRDPIDRFLSNFYWAGLVMCHDSPSNEGNEKRKIMGTVPMRPHKKCKKKGEKSTIQAEVVHTKYKGNANNLAQALCSNDEAEREEATQDLRKFAHVGDSIRDWLTFYYDDTEHRTPVGIVLEKGFNFTAQLDGATEFAVRHSLWWEEEERQQQQGTAYHKNETRLKEQARKLFQTKLDVLDFKHEKKHDHTQHRKEGNNFPPWINTMQQHQVEGLSTRSACCLAETFYREDYKLIVPPASRGRMDGTNNGSSDNNNGGDADGLANLSPLAEIACHGPAAEECRNSLMSIAQRYIDLKCASVLGTATGDSAIAVAGSTDHHDSDDNNNNRNNTNSAILDARDDNNAQPLLLRKEERVDLSMLEATIRVSELSLEIAKIALLILGFLFVLYHRNKSRARRGLTSATNSGVLT